MSVGKDPMTVAQDRVNECVRNLFRRYEKGRRIHVAMADLRTAMEELDRNRSPNGTMTITVPVEDDGEPPVAVQDALAGLTGNHSSPAPVEQPDAEPVGKRECTCSPGWPTYCALHWPPANQSSSYRHPAPKPKGEKLAELVGALPEIRDNLRNDGWHSLAEFLDEVIKEQEGQAGK